MNEAPGYRDYAYNDPRNAVPADEDQARRGLEFMWPELGPALIDALAQAFAAGTLPQRWDDDISDAILAAEDRDAYNAADLDESDLAIDRFLRGDA